MRPCGYCWKLRRGAVSSLLKLSLFQFYWLQTTNMKNRIISLGLVRLLHQGRLKRLTEGHLDRIESSRAKTFRLSWVLGVSGRRSRTGFVAMRTSFVWYGKVSKDTHNYMVITLLFRQDHFKHWLASSWYKLGQKSSNYPKIHNLKTSLSS